MKREMIESMTLKFAEQYNKEFQEMYINLHGDNSENYFENDQEQLIDIIHSSFEQLPTQIKREYLAEARCLSKEIVLSLYGITDPKLDDDLKEKIANSVHESWKRRNSLVYSKEYGDPQLAGAFKDLPDHEKQNMYKHIEDAFDEYKNQILEYQKESQQNLNLLQKKHNFDRVINTPEKLEVLETIGLTRKQMLHIYNDFKNGVSADIARVYAVPGIEESIMDAALQDLIDVKQPKSPKMVRLYCNEDLTPYQAELVHYYLHQNMDIEALENFINHLDKIHTVQDIYKVFKSEIMEEKTDVSEIISASKIVNDLVLMRPEITDYETFAAKTNFSEPFSEPEELEEESDDLQTDDLQSDFER